MELVRPATPPPPPDRASTGSPEPGLGWIVDQRILSGWKLQDGTLVPPSEMKGMMSGPHVGVTHRGKKIQVPVKTLILS
jgi:hypothetical protein